MIEQYVNAEELKRLISSLLVFVGALVIAALFASIIVPGLRNANSPAAPTPVDPVVGEPGWLDPTEFPAEAGKEIPPIDPKVVMAASPKWVSRGKDLFAANCVQCHGEAGKGDGPASSTMNPHPRNFTSPEGWVNGHDLPAIFKTLSEGIKNTSMAPFDYLPKTDRMALAHFVQTLGQFPHGAGTEQSLKALETELASVGGRTPNRIPVSMAIAKLEKEFVPVPDLVLDPNSHSPAAETLRRIVVSPRLAAQTLSSAMQWQTGPRELARVVSVGAPTNGFAVGSATLSEPEWQAVYSELKERAGGKRE
jgi:mono/diheme cytochrome c family protein